MGLNAVAPQLTNSVLANTRGVHRAARGPVRRDGWQGRGRTGWRNERVRYLEHPAGVRLVRLVQDSTVARAPSAISTPGSSVHRKSWLHPIEHEARLGILGHSCQPGWWPAID